jgi:hypothetical protein
MWPFHYLRRRKYERHYKAALVVFLSEKIYARLDANERARVGAEVNDNFNRSWLPAPAYRKAQWDVIAASRATAMARLGIEPAVPGLSWADLLAPWTDWRSWWPQWPVTRGFDNRATWLLLDFHEMDGATADAKAFLAKYEPDRSQASIAV